ncbi:MAG: hypothetical protein M3Q65_23775 [Chloroflexota bacterium]|nr:hypothetical protein [Chloroflexota bacterium]
MSRHWQTLLADAGLAAGTRRLPSGRVVQEVKVAVQPVAREHEGSHSKTMMRGGHEIS